MPDQEQHDQTLTVDVTGLRDGELATVAGALTRACSAVNLPAAVSLTLGQLAHQARQLHDRRRTDRTAS
ncbi:hypothetical protein COO58_17615 [Micromonospora sp. WMMA1996]|uniref:hypothetical protein n=1 Tax=Micromonospora sp. WMMA1996 TaxID=2039878 RepID=UPI000C016A57|nr:hypothetical protein [Micromonospora sp. WMMA1996]PGH46026.1 hypothetical protein COO58_17615 [Micromonospora sp. WMMA1996]